MIWEKSGLNLDEAQQKSSLPKIDYREGAIEMLTVLMGFVALPDPGDGFGSRMHT